MGSFLKQRVNSFLCIALLALITFWVVLYYLSAKAQIIGTEYAGPYMTILNVP